MYKTHEKPKPILKRMQTNSSAELLHELNREKSLQYIDADPMLDGSSYGMEPTDEQLAQINRYIPLGAKPLTADDVITVPIVAANNLMQWSREAWHPRSLEAMRTGLIGKKFAVDHGDRKGGTWGQSWDGVETIKGRIYATRLESYSTCPDKLMKVADHEECNRHIVDNFGYQVLYVDAFFDRKLPIAREIRFGTHLDVSTGTYGAVNYYCPLCSDFKNGKEVSFFDQWCPHMAPTADVLRAIALGYLDEEEMSRVAPYMVQDGAYHGVELSSVFRGNLPNARMVNVVDAMEGTYHE